jgi:hypothetical protein
MAQTDLTSIGGIGPHGIYEKITRKFTYPGGNGSKRKNDTIFFSNKYDEPTYLTFRIDFDFMNTSYGDSYNEVPHALLNIVTKDFVVNGQPNTQDPLIKSISASDYHYIINDNDFDVYSKNSENAKYSAYNYLMYSLGESLRAKMLLQFKMGLYDLVKYCPYYFTSIEGVGNLMKVNTSSGVRIPSDSGTITIKCEDALDMRVTQIMNLYRKVAWDDVYQRWILPDIMRYFKMYIYITEIRVFHTTPSSNSITNNINGSVDSVVPSEFLSEARNLENPSIPGISTGILNTGDFELINNAMNDIMPTIKLECSMCEFDMSDVMSHINTLSSSKGGEPIKPTIKIKVGNVKEVQVYGLDKNFGNRGISNVYSHIISDNVLRRQNIIVDQFKGDKETDLLTPIEAMTADPLQRLGIDISKTDRYKPFNRTETQLALFVNGIMQKLRAEETLGLNALLNHLSTATSYRVRSIIPTLLNSVIGHGLYPASLATQNIIDRGVTSILGFPLRNGILFGDIIQSELTGNPIPIISAIKDYTRDNAANQELKDLYNRDNWEEMLKEILKDISRSAATQGVNDRFTKTIDFILNGDPSAADVGRKIDQLYDDYLTGLSSETNNDIDKGYRDTSLFNTNIRSGATQNSDIKNTYDSQLKGVSDEANKDTDKGYHKTNLYQSPYISTANSGNINELYDDNKKGTSNEANIDIDYRGYKTPNMIRTSYISTANIGYVQNPYDPSLFGLSDEANEDNDSGYKKPTIENPEYRSTANEISRNNELYPNELRGLSDEANEDNDNGYSEPTIENPEYKSTAADRKVTTDQQKRDIYSEANENRDKRSL